MADIWASVNVVEEWLELCSRISKSGCTVLFFVALLFALAVVRAILVIVVWIEWRIVLDCWITIVQEFSIAVTT